MLVLLEDLYVPVLVCTIFVIQLNKIVLINHTIKSLYGIYCMAFKNMFFWFDTNYKLVPGLCGCRKNIYYLSDPLMVWVNLP